MTQRLFTQRQGDYYISGTVYEAYTYMGYRLTYPVSHYTKIEQFHVRFGLTYEEAPRKLDTDMALFRIGFMIEELAEYAEASGFDGISSALANIHMQIKSDPDGLRNSNVQDIEKQFDSLIDLVYVALGTSYLQGFPFDEGFTRVHHVNMQKVRVEREGDDARSTRKSKYDVVKPDGWKPADLSDLVGIEKEIE